jgi:hypothetical protein
VPRSDIRVGEPAWFEARRVRFTGTDWASFFTPPQHRPRWLPSKLQIWERLTGRSLPAEEADAHLEWGLRLEPSAELWYEALTKREVEREECIWLSGETMCADPDGWLGPSDPDFYIVGTGPWAWEAKAPGPYGAQHWDTPDGGQQVPLVYQIQAQGRMHVTGAVGTSICALSWPRLLWGDVPRNQKFIDAALAKIERFWDYNVRGDRPPEPSASEKDAQIIARMHNSEAKVEVLTPELVQLCLDIDALDAEIDELDARRLQKRNALRLWMQQKKCERAVNPERTFAWSFGKGGLRRVNP